jgi:uncharacterized membrane protein
MKGNTVGNQDEYAQRLLEPLRGEPEGAPRIDVPRAMREGRRRRRVRGWSTAVLATAVTAVTAGGGTVMVAAARDDSKPPRPEPTASAAVVPATPAPKRKCTVTRLPTGGIKKAVVTSGDPSGHYLAGRVYPPGKSQNVDVVVWKDGKLVDTPDMPGSDASLRDINSSGVAVGTSYDGDEQQAYVYRDGAFTKLAGPGAVSGINDAGVMVGSIGSDIEPNPVRWASPGAKPQRLPLPDGVKTAVARDVDEDGTILGLVALKEGQDTAYLWMADGTHRATPAPTVDGKKADAFWPDSMAAGKVIGRAVFESKDSMSFKTVLYDIASGEYTEVFPLDAPRIAADGTIFGVEWTDRRMGLPVLMTGDQKTKLPSGGRREFVVSSISSDGRTLAGYSVGSEETGPISNDPWMWTCG